MAIYHSLDEYLPDGRGCRAALGFFDGVHLGHRAVISGGDDSGLRRVVLTFTHSPAKALGAPFQGLLTDNKRKAELLTQAGAQDIIFADFGALRDMSAEDFVGKILVERLRAKQVCCGFNYRFGKGGEGDVKRLSELCSKYGIEVEAREPVTVSGEQASSSRIRELIASGDIRRANEMLGCRYSISGDIAGGNHLGTEMGFPTVNIPIGGELIVPRYGVYASRVIVGGREYIGATNIGVHPTVGENELPLCESFLLDYDGGDLYGKYAVCELCDFVRDERMFGSFDELRAQIDADCARIREITDTESDRGRPEGSGAGTSVR